MPVDNDRLQVIDKAKLLVPSEIVNSATEVVIDSSLYRLHQEVGDYAFQFGTYSQNFSYKVTGYQVSDPISAGTFSIEMSKYENVILAVDGLASEVPYVFSDVSNPDIVMQDTKNVLDINLNVLGLKVDAFSSEGEAKGFLSQLIVGNQKLKTNFILTRGERIADLAIHIEQQRLTEPDLFGIEVVTEDNFDYMLQSFPDLDVSLTEFAEKVSAHLMYDATLSNNYDAREAAAKVIYITLTGEQLSNSELYDSDAALDQLIDDVYLQHTNSGTVEGFSGYTAYVGAEPLEVNNTPLQDIKTDAELVEALTEATFVEQEGTIIAETKKAEVTIENVDGSTFNVTIDPVQHKIDIFNGEFADAEINGVILSSNTEIITNTDGSINEITSAQIQGADGNLHFLEQSKLAESSAVPENGILLKQHIITTDSQGNFVGQGQKTLFERGDKIHETSEFQFTDGGDWTVQQVIKEPDGMIIDESPVYHIPSSDLIQTFQLIGGTAGSFLADKLADGDAFKSIAYKALISTITDQFGTFSAFLAEGTSLDGAIDAAGGLNVENTSLDTPEFKETFYKNLNAAVSSTLANVIVSEVGETLGIDGVAGEVLEVAAGTVTTGVISGGVELVFEGLDNGVYANILSGSFNFNDVITVPDVINGGEISVTLGDYLQFQVFNAIGSYAGGRLAGEVVQPESTHAAIFGAIGSAYAGLVGTAVAGGASLSLAVGAAFSSASSALAAGAAVGSVVPIIGTAIGAFIGTIAGTFFGNLFGDEDIPSAWARVDYDGVDKQYELSTFWENNDGQIDISNGLAQKMISAVNEILDISHGALRQNSIAPHVQIGYRGDEYRVMNVGTGEQRSFDTASEAVLYGAFSILSGFDIVGGHAVIMRAWHNSTARNIYEFKDDLQVAEAFQLYLANPTGILALMMNEPDSELAQNWAAILTRAAELELHLPHEKDLDGGWGEVLNAQGVDAALIPDIDGDSIILTNPETGEETVLHHVIGPGYEIVRIEGTDGNDIIEVMVDGNSITHVDVGAGDDIVNGSEEDDIIIGGSGDDILNGFGGDDWLHGGSGEDTIDGGDGHDLLVGAQDNDILIGGDGNDKIYGYDGDDELIAGIGGNDILYGGNGNDRLYGNGYSVWYSPSQVTNTRLHGGAGDDYLFAYNHDFSYGGAGDDTLTTGEWGYGNTYVIGRGAGHDTIISSFREINTIQFDNTIGYNELYFKQEDADLKILVLGENQSVTVKDYFSSLPPKLSIEAHEGKIIASSRSNILAAVANDATISETPTGLYNYISDSALANAVDDAESANVWTSQSRWHIQWGNQNSESINSFLYWVSAGGAGNDTIQSDRVNGFQIFFGDSGNDTIYGYELEDLIVGGLGNDHLYGHGDRDRIYGGHGDDYLSGGEQDDFLSGGASNDHLIGGSGDDTIFGDDGDDHIEGNIGSNSLYGGSGNDTIIASGSNGSNSLHGETGDDEVTGGSGSDTIYGDEGNDILNGSAGNDWLDAGIGHDVLIAGSGDDSLYGGEGDDTYHYTAGHDRIIEVGSGLDTLIFDASWNLDDVIVENNVLTFVNNTTDSITFNDINLIETFRFDGHADLTAQDMLTLRDETFVGTLAVEAFDGGDGVDTVDYSAATGRVTVRLDNGTGGHNEAAGDTYINIENIIGSQYHHDYLYGNDSDNHLQALDGSDRLYGSLGADIMDGGGNTDTVYYNYSYEAVAVDLQSSTQQIGGYAEGDILISIEHAYGSNYNDIISGTDGYNRLYGKNGNDVIHGRDGDDRLYGDGGDDTLTGGQGDDDLFGGLGGDTAIFSGNYAAYVITDNAGVLTVQDTVGMDGTDELTDIERLVFSNGALENGVFTSTANNSSPIAVSDNATIDQDQAITVDVLINDSDSDNDPLIVSIATAAASGTAIVNADNTITYTPHAGFFGSDSFTYTVDDGLGGNDAATVNITVNEVVSADDTFVGTLTVEEFDGQDGIDTVDYSAATGRVTVNLLNGTGTHHEAAGDTYANIENVIGTNHAQDSLYGNDADNHLQALDGSDRLYGSLGADIMDGGGNTDTVYYSFSHEAVTVDLASSGPQVGGYAEGDTLISVEHAYGSNYNDIISGTNGYNRLYGKNGHDSIYGFAGDDRLYGDGGNDMLYGGDGLDDLYGGSGADTFFFDGVSAFNNIDEVYDFSLAENDKLDLSDVLQGYDALTDVITDFVQITDDGTDSFVSVDADGGADSFVQIATLLNTTGLTDEQTLETNGVLITI